MKMLAACIECANNPGQFRSVPFLAPYYENRTVEVTCSQGHRSAILIQHQKFEVLLESGADALSEGFTLEACASFSAALERLYEFATKVLATHQGMSKVVYEATFDEMSRQSERQLGAFLMLYALQFKSNYKPNKKITEIRNSVIHKGKIPTPEEANKFCSMVYTEVVNITSKLKSELMSAVLQTISNDMRERHEKIPATMPRSSLIGLMFFSLNRSEVKNSFGEAYKDFQGAKRNSKIVFSNDSPMVYDYSK